MGAMAEDHAVSQLIEPRTLKGFRDYEPKLMIPRERVLQTARDVYRSYGFAPIDTPALEYAEVLLGKGGEESDRSVMAVAKAAAHFRDALQAGPAPSTIPA